MKKKTLFIPLLGFLTLAVSINYNNQTKKELNSNVIVSLKDYSNLSKEEEQKYFYNELNSLIGLNYRKVARFDELTNILTLKINKDDLLTIKKLDSINYAYLEQTYEYEPLEFDADDPTYFYGSSNQAMKVNESAKAMNKRNSKDGENTIVAILDSSFNINQNVYKALTSEDNPRYSELEMTNLISQTGFHAKNADYINSKIPFVYDYVGNDTNTNSTSEHGNHVASIIASNNNYLGIAPSAQIAFMKVFNDREGGCTTTVYLKALQDAYLLNVDAINMSFGSSLTQVNSDEDKAVQELINKMSEEGIKTFIASGNDGKDTLNGSLSEFATTDNLAETGVMGQLASSNNGNTVGSSTLKEDVSNIYGFDGTSTFPIYDRTKDKMSVSTVGTNKYEYSLTDFPKDYLFKDFLNTKKEYVVIDGYGDASDYQNVDVKGKIALVKRGSIPFYAKIHFALKNGASGLLIAKTKSDEAGYPYFSYELTEDYSSLPSITENGKILYDYKSINIPVGLISYEAYERLIDNEDKTLDFKQKALSTFSTQGVGVNLDIKPDFVAPGTNIFGALNYINDGVTKTYTNNAYTFKSGTSMAAPNAAGAYLSTLSNENLGDDERRKSIANQITIRLSNNAEILTDFDGDYLQPHRQGSGELDIYNAKNYESTLTYKENGKAKVELKNNEDISKGILNFSLNFNRNSLEAKTYKVRVSVIASELTTLNEFNNDQEFVTSGTKTLEVYEFDYTTNKKLNVIDINHVLNAESKAYLDKFENGCYLEGYVEVIDENDTVHVPFLGVYGEVSNQRYYEPFSFQKEENRIYQSDLFDDTIANLINKNKEYVKTGSYILSGEDGSYYRRNIVRNTMKVFDHYSDVEVYYDEDTNETHLYTGEFVNFEKGLTIQLFMYKNAKGGKVTLKNDDVSIESVFQNGLSSYSGYSQLFKSEILTQDSILVGNGAYMHRLYAYIDYELEDGSDLPIDEYDLEISITGYDDVIQTEKFKIHIGQKYVARPEIYDISLKENVLRIYFKKDTISHYEVNGNKVDIDLTTNMVEIDTINETEDLCFVFYSKDLATYSFKYFANSDLMFIHGVNVNDNMHLYKSKYYDDNETLRGMIYGLVNKNNNYISLSRPIIYGLKGDKNNLDYIFCSLYYDYEINPQDNNYEGVVTYKSSEVAFYQAYKLNQNNSNNNYFTYIYIGIGGAVALILVLSTVIIVSVNKKKHKKH